MKVSDQLKVREGSDSELVQFTALSFNRCVGVFYEPLVSKWVAFSRQMEDCGTPEKTVRNTLVSLAQILESKEEAANKLLNPLGV